LKDLDNPPIGKRFYPVQKWFLDTRRTTIFGWTLPTIGQGIQTLPLIAIHLNGLKVGF